MSGSASDTVSYLIEINEDNGEIELVQMGETECEDVKEIIEHVCSKCNRTFTDFEILKTHLRMCRTKNVSKLTTIYQGGGLVEHFVPFETIEETEKECKELDSKGICFCCEEDFDFAHMGYILCKICPKSFKSQKSFERHLFFMHADDNPYNCDICNAKCISTDLLTMHKKLHNSTKPFACQKCGKDFSRKYHLIRHQKHSSCDLSNVNPLECKVCGKTFNRIDNLKIHLRKHLGELKPKRDFKCPYCEKAFYTSSILNIHIRTHTGEKPYACDICQRNFPTSVAVRKHRRIHTGEKPFSCSVCQRAFAAKEVLNRHMKTHTGDRKYACNFCEKRFIQATQLRSHLANHIKHQNEKSSNSNNSSSSKKTKRSKAVSPDKTKEKIPCPHCSKSYANKGSLDRHINYTHPFEGKDEVVFEITTDLEGITNISSPKEIIDERESPTRVTRSSKRTAQMSSKKCSKSPKNQTILKSETTEEENEEGTVIFMDDDTLKESIGKLLTYLLDEDMLSCFGWPSTCVEQVLSEVIKHCGHTPSSYENCSDYTTSLRENVKLLFTSVIDNNTIKALLNNHTIDEVINQVLKMATTPNKIESNN